MAFLFIRSRDETPTRLKLTNPVTRLGRSNDNEIPISRDPSVSRFHAEIILKGEDHFVHDKGSLHGTLVNGRAIGGERKLKSGDRVKIGETTLIYSAGDELPAGNEEDTAVSVQAASLSSRTIAIPVSEIMSSVKVEPEVTAEEAVVLTPTAQSRAFALLSRAASQLLSQQSIEQILELFMDLIMEAASPERGAILLLEGDPPELRVRAHRETGSNGDQPLKISSTITQKVMQEEQAVLTEDAQIDDLLAGSESIYQVGIRSALCVPLWDNEQVIGLIYADSVESERRYDKGDLELATLLGNLAAIKIQNSRLFLRDQQMREMEQELAAAARIQQRLLPAAPPEIPGYELAGVNLPCREVGGDYFDYLPRRDGRYALALGDVSGKGIGGALLMAMLHACCHAQAGLDIPLSEVVARVNNVVYTHSDPERFITFFCCELDAASGRLTCVNAGHNPPLLFQADGIVKEVRHPQLILGIRPDVSYVARDLQLQPGDLLILYSDGVTESRSPDGHEFEVGGLVRTVKANLHRPLTAMRDAIVDAARSFAGSAEQADDLTVSLIRRL